MTRSIPSFGKFQYYVALAMTYGLTAEPEPGSKPNKPAKSDTSGKSDKNEQCTILRTGTTGTAQVWRLCFDKSAWAPGAKFADQPSDVRLEREDEGPARA